ncbi:MAG TPA: glycosyltransferase [Acidimicrobiales bacterium]|nr:glycosyltransferase [Acidimicrobiales bacterium]
MPDDAVARHLTALSAGLTASGHEVTVHSPWSGLGDLGGARIVTGGSLMDLLLDGDADVVHLTSADPGRLGPWAYGASAAPVVLTVSAPMAKVRAAGLAHVAFASDTLRRQVPVVAGRPRVSILPLLESADMTGLVAAHETLYRSVVARRHRGTRRWLSAQLCGSLNRTRRSPRPTPDPGGAVERVGVAVTSYRRPTSLRRCLDGVARLPQVVAVCVVDNSPDPGPIERPPGLPARTRFEVVADGENRGLPAALAAAWARLADSEAILVLDDDTVPTPELLDDLIAALDPGTGAAGLPDRYSLRYSGAGPPRLIAWSPSLIRTDAVDDVGPPRPDLFFGHDDYEFSLRLGRAGWRIAWVPHDVAELRAATPWPERHYFNVRNGVWLATRGWPPALPAWLLAGDMVWMLGSMLVAEARSTLAGRPSPLNRRGTRAALAGLGHGAVGRLGPPPRWVLEGRDRT